MKEASNTITDELLAKYLLGEATMAEAEDVRAWLPQHPENQRYFNHLKLIWEQSRELAAHSTVNGEAAWLRLQDQILAATEARIIRMRQRRRILGAAAAVLLAAVAVIWWLQGSKQQTALLTLRADSSVIKHTLPDGSIVTLNKHTTLEYQGRQARLKGEAFFEIQPDERHPFEVIAGGDTLQVLGTSFNISTDSQGKEWGMKVVVETGAVRIVTEGDTVQVLPGEMATSSPIGLEDKKPVQDQLYAYYRTHQFVCNNLMLAILAMKLEEVYGVEITIANRELMQLKINATFQDNSLDQILSVIGKTFPEINIERHGQQIYIK